jgi:hypothetical protein
LTAATTAAWHRVGTNDVLFCDELGFTLLCMSELWRAGSTPPNSFAKVRVARLAERQSGVLGWGQLLALAVSKATISAWVADGYLHRVHPTVYAVGHRAISVQGQLIAALLYAGPGALLSHATAAWWWRLTDRQPARIDVTTPTRRSSLPGVHIHGRRQRKPVHHRGLPVTTIAQTLLDYATTTQRRVERALAEADYRRLLNQNELNKPRGRGKPGSARLTKAMDSYLPDLALTRSPLEETFLPLCHAGELPAPLVNMKVNGLTVDALWPTQRVIVELDGDDGHTTPAQIHRDRRRELTLRKAGYDVLRYTWHQVNHQADEVLPDLRRALGA